MSTERIDADIQRLRAAAQTVAANLGELRRDPGFELVAAATLHGLTAERWAEAHDELERVDVWFARFRTFLDDAGTRRGMSARLAPEHEREVDEFLHGPSIELARDEVPLAERGLLGTASSITRCSADELLNRMSAAFDAAKTAILTIATTWDSLVPRVRDIRDALTALDDRTTLSPDDRLTIGTLQDELDRLAEDLVLDTLVVVPDDLDRLEGKVVAITAELAAVDELQADASERLRYADALHGQLRGAVADAEAAHREVLEKIAAPSVPAPAPVADEISTEIDRVRAMVMAGRWRDAERALAAWTARVDDLLRDALDCAAANRAPLEARNQLRGRLDGYRAMAIRRGVLEDVQLAALHARARDALYTAPTDLADAEASVQAYREALPRESADRKASS
jgi:hypothetical protein